MAANDTKKEETSTPSHYKVVSEWVGSEHKEGDVITAHEAAQSGDVANLVYIGALEASKGPSSKVPRKAEAATETKATPIPAPTTPTPTPAPVSTSTTPTTEAPSPAGVSEGAGTSTATGTGMGSGN